MDVFEDFSTGLPQVPFWCKQVLSGPHENFHYLVGDPATRRAAAIDPAFHLDALFGLAEADGYRVDTAIFTHGHWDHIGGIPAIFDWEVERVVLHEAASGHPKAQQAGGRLQTVRDGDRFSVGRLGLEALHTPGHQPESTCFVVGDRLLFGGDTLFVGSCGRTDFPGGDTDAMFASLGRLRKRAAPNLHLMPGHHYHEQAHRSLDVEARANPALSTTDRAAFEALPFLRD